jgi:hypothetical protein
MAATKQPGPPPGTYHEEQIIGGPKGHMVKVMNADQMKPVWLAQGMQPGSFPSDTNPNPNDPSLAARRTPPVRQTEPARQQLLRNVARDIPPPEAAGGIGERPGFDPAEVDADLAWQRKVISDQHNSNGGGGTGAGLQIKMMELAAERAKEERTTMTKQAALNNYTLLKTIPTEAKVQELFPNSPSYVQQWRMAHDPLFEVTKDNMDVFLPTVVPQAAPAPAAPAPAAPAPAGGSVGGSGGRAPLAPYPTRMGGR